MPSIDELLFEGDWGADQTHGTEWEGQQSGVTDAIDDEPEDYGDDGEVSDECSEASYWEQAYREACEGGNCDDDDQINPTPGDPDDTVAQFEDRDDAFEGSTDNFDGGQSYMRDDQSDHELEIESFFESLGI